MKFFRLISMFLIAAFAIIGVGCNSVNNAVHENEKVSIKDFEWKIEEGISSSKRYLLMTLTNNSEYNIHEFELVLKPKKTLSGERLEEFYEYFQNEYNMSDEDMEYFKEYGSLRIECNRYSFDGPMQPGKTETIHCDYYGYLYVLNDDYFEYFEEDMVTIVYEDNGYLYTIYYDYRSNKYSHESEAELID